MNRKYSLLLIACLGLLLLAGGMVSFAQDEPVTITAWGHAHMPRVAARRGDDRSLHGGESPYHS